MKTSKYKIKIVCGYRKEQEFTIDANETHKAYYLFNHPDKRGTFNNGLAIKGSDIQRIEPDYVATMGWNHTHQLTHDDHNELRANGVAEKIQGIMYLAKEVARNGKKEELIKPLIELKQIYPQLASREGSEYAKKLLQTGKNKTYPQLSPTQSPKR